MTAVWRSRRVLAAGRWVTSLVVACFVLATCRACGSTTSAAQPPSLRSECDAPRAEWIWCDDFETDRIASYFEYDRAGGRFVREPGVGLSGSYGMKATWGATGQVAAGFLHLAFGRTPAPFIRAVAGQGEDYREVYWRIYLKTDPGWTGGGGEKLTRAQILATSSWAQAMVAPVWAGPQGPDKDRLVLDPASGTDPSGVLRTTTYGDLGHLRFLGSVAGQNPIFAPGADDRWHCIEAHVALNSKNSADGIFESWVDDRLDARLTGLNWVGSYADYGINTVFVENYWNGGAPQPQSRVIDQLVVSRTRIGCSGH